MIVVDVARSTITIAHRTFPAAAVVFREPAEHSEWDRTLGGYTHLATYHDILIPSENGVLINVSWSERQPEPVTIEVCVYAPRAEHFFEADRYALPLLSVRHGQLERLSRMRPAPWHWASNDHEWVVEHIERLGRLPSSVAVQQHDIIRLMPLHAAPTKEESRR